MGTERREHEHVRGSGTGTGPVAPDQIPTVGRTESPRDLELAEAEQGCDRGRLTGEGYCPGVLIAYLLGAIGTIGSLIWLRWLISCVHWLGCSTLPISAESCLLMP